MNAPFTCDYVLENVRVHKLKRKTIQDFWHLPALAKLYQVPARISLLPALQAGRPIRRASTRRIELS
jgi:hypothetical protein